MFLYIADKEHYTKVLALCEKVKHDQWIGMTNLIGFERALFVTVMWIKQTE